MLLTETHLETLSKNIARQLFTYIKSWDGNKFIKIFIINNTPIKLIIKNEPSIENNTVRVKGDTTNDQIKVYVLCKDKQIQPSLYELIYTRLTNILRHELEHFKQLQSNNIDSPYDSDKILSGDPDEIEKYLTHPMEVEAYVSDIYLAAKQGKTTFNEIFKKRMHSFVNSMLKNQIDKKTIFDVLSHVKKIWFQYAMKRFPKAQLT